jgi:hypothetical protein
VLAVVYEAMADAGTRGKSSKVSGPHRMSNAVYPRVHFTFKDVHKLFLFLLGVRPRTSLTGNQSLKVHADLEQPGSFAEATFIAGVSSLCGYWWPVSGHDAAAMMNGGRWRRLLMPSL